MLKDNDFAINMIEHKQYHHHNMAMICLGTINLMASPGLDLTELGSIRELLTLGQTASRIANSICTWQREIQKKDYSSGVMRQSILQKVVDLREDDSTMIEKVESSSILKEHLTQWKSLFLQMKRASPKVVCVDMTKYTEAMHTFLVLQVGSFGLQ